MQTAPDIAACMYYTGIDPFTRQEVYVAKGLRDRKMQRALMQLFKRLCQNPAFGRFFKGSGRFWQSL